MGSLLIIVGFMLLINAVVTFCGVDTSIHQVYAQEQFTTSAICICGGCIIRALQDIKKELNKTPENKPDQENIN